jgi:hypothetical protein
MLPYQVSKIFMVWLCVVYATLAGLIYGFPTSLESPFFHYGPNKDFKVLGIHVDTYAKYCIIVGYCFSNSIFRTLHGNYLHPWIVNNIQDEKADKSGLIKKEVFLVVCVSVLYHWTDWLLYMNILLSQIDMLIIEIIADLGMSCLTTTYYLKDTNDKKLKDSTGIFDIPYIPYVPVVVDVDSD